MCADDGTGRRGILSRALGVETEVRLDYVTQPLARHDRFLLCSDGVHGFLTAETIAEILRERSASEDTARALVAAALQSGSTDNCTALVVDVVDLPAAELADIGAAIMQLPLIPLPVAGETVDGFVLKVLVSDGRYTRLFGAVDEIEGGEVVLKFPKPQVAAVATYRAAFVREAWVGARVHSPWIGRIMELPPGRQTCLYIVMPLYQGELLETRLARRPLLDLEEGRNIAIKLARGAAALHRVGVIHRDIKPDNVILEGGGSLKLIDLGVVRVPGLEDFPPEDIPGDSRLYGARNVCRRTWERGHRHLRPGRHHVPRLYRRVSLWQSRCHQPAAPEPAGGALRSAAGPSGLAPGCTRAGHRDRSPGTFSRYDRICSEMEAGPARRPLAVRGRKRSMNVPRSKSGRAWRRSSRSSSSYRCCGIRAACLIPTWSEPAFVSPSECQLLTLAA